MTVGAGTTDNFSITARDVRTIGIEELRGEFYVAREWLYA